MRPHEPTHPRLETVAMAPNLWYPNDKLNHKESDTTFYNSLDIPLLRDSFLKRFLPESQFPREERGWGAPNIYTNISRYFDSIFLDGLFEPGLANYRLDIMDYLRLNPDSRKNFGLIFDELANLTDLNNYRESDSLKDLLKKGKVYCTLINGFKPFPSDSPQGLLNLNEHFEQVNTSPAYRKLEEIVRKTEDGFDLQMTWRCTSDLEGENVVSASIHPINEKVNEFGDNFNLYYFGNSDDKPIKKIISRSIELKFKKHFANAQEQINQTLKLLPQTAIYLGYLDYVEHLETRGVKFSKPEFLPKEETRAEILNAHHPLISEKNSSVGNPIIYNQSSQISVITGPNKGGKSVYIKSVGLVHALGLKGFLVPAEKAEFSARDGIYTHFIQPEDITKGESRFSDEMKRMQSIFTQATPYSLTLLDEPCGGTTLSAGEIKTREFLQLFGELGCPVFITTHMEGITRDVLNGLIPKASNKHLSFSNKNGKFVYHYKLVDEPAQMDYGAQIADSLGLGAKELRELIQRRAETEGFKLADEFYKNRI